jgi:hypothetical protein
LVPASHFAVLDSHAAPPQLIKRAGAHPPARRSVQDQTRERIRLFRFERSGRGKEEIRVTAAGLS